MAFLAGLALSRLAKSCLCSVTDACVGSRVVVVATTSRARDLSAVVTAAFVHQVGMESPSEEQRHIMLGSLSQKLSMGMNVNLEKLSKLTMVNDYPAC